MNAFLFYLNYWRSYIFALLAFVGGLFGGYWSYLGLATIFIIHPIMDNLIFKNSVVPQIRPKSFWSQPPIVMAFPFLCVFSFGGLLLAMQATWLELFGLILSFGSIMGVLGINTAHELVHRREVWLRRLGLGILTLVNFSHWETEHVHGHHKRVGTLEDSATARKNEWIYFYYFRSYFGAFINAFKIERARLHAQGFHALWKNKIVWLSLLQLIVTFSVLIIAGPAGLVFWMGQSVVAIVLLETVDYVEHYALERQRNAEGHYESVKAHHSWDSYKTWTNYSLFNLGFHSHHHHKASLPFYELKEQKGAMKLPFGYSAMALMALVPPLYFGVMNPRLNDQQSSTLSKKNSRSHRESDPLELKKVNSAQH